jgi:predicted Zn-ribbon and HTH transcriptional regulator
VTPAAESSSDTMPSKVNQIANVHKLQRKNIIINPPPPQHNTPPKTKHKQKQNIKQQPDKFDKCGFRFSSQEE